MRPQGPDHVVRVVRLVRVPDEADGDDLGGIHQDLSDANPLPTSALGGEKAGGGNEKMYRTQWELGGGSTHKTFVNAPTGQLRSSPIDLAACSSSPNDSCLRWCIC